LHKQSFKQENHGTCLAKPLHTKQQQKCLADNRTAKYEASVGPDENLSPSVRRISKTLIHGRSLSCLGTGTSIKSGGLNHSLSCLGTGTSIKSGGVKLVLKNAEVFVQFYTRVFKYKKK